jgi:hypothetical protein
MIWLCVRMGCVVYNFVFRIGEDVLSMWCDCCHFAIEVNQDQVSDCRNVVKDEVTTMSLLGIGGNGCD